MKTANNGVTRSLVLRLSSLVVGLGTVSIQSLDLKSLVQKTLVVGFYCIYFGDANEYTVLYKNFFFM